MIIIIEGMDNCGKSTLIKKLSSEDKNPKKLCFNSTSPPKGVESDWAIYNNFAVFGKSMDLSEDGWNIYMDRAHLGETVYAPLYRDMDPSWVWKMERELELNEECVLIVMVCDKTHAEEHNDGNNISDDHHDEERKLFENSYRTSSIENKLLVDVSDKGFEESQKEIEEWLETV